MVQKSLERMGGLKAATGMIRKKRSGRRWSGRRDEQSTLCGIDFKIVN